MTFIYTYHWWLLIGLEVIAVLALIIFGLSRYLFSRPRLSFLFLAVFIAMICLEGVLGLLIYQKTGEFDLFQLVVLIFILYAFTLGIFDFIKLDRTLRQKIGDLRKIDLLTDKDKEILARQKDPVFLARKYRRSSYIHTLLFFTFQITTWLMGTESLAEIGTYLSDFSWVNHDDSSKTPYPNDSLYKIGVVWTIVYVVDLIYSWSYTFMKKQ